MVGVADDYVNATIHEAAGDLRETHLIRPWEERLVVLSEAIVSVSHGIGRIRVDEVSPSRPSQYGREVSSHELDAAERLRRRVDRIRLNYVASTVRTEGDVEFSI